MHKIFVAQKSYCACRVLSLANKRSKYYFNFILNRTGSGRERFDYPSYMLSQSGIFKSNSLLMGNQWKLERSGDAIQEIRQQFWRQHFGPSEVYKDVPYSKELE